MQQPTDSVQAWNVSVRKLSRWLAFGSFCVAMLGFATTLAGTIASMVTGWKAMTPVSAIAQALVAAVLASERLPSWLRRLMLALSAGLVAPVLARHLRFGEDVVSPAIGRIFGVTPASISAEMALSLLLIALVVWPARGWPRPGLRDAVAAIVFIIAVGTVVGYAYDAVAVNGYLPFRSMSADSAASLLMLSTATILSEPEAGWAKVLASPALAGRVTRRQMLYVLVPVVLGFILVRANRSGLVPVGAAIALLVVFTAVPLLWLVIRDGRMLGVLDDERAERLRLEQGYGADLQTRLDAQAAELEISNRKLLAHAQAASVRNKVRYRQLFDSIDAGFCVVEMKFDGAGLATDYRFVEVNPAFERQTGLVGAAGRWMRSLQPEHEQRWFDLYGEVARTGKSARFESPAAELGGRWYDVYAFRIGEEPAALVGILFNDITSRRTMELELQAVNDTLEQRVEAAVAEREEAQAALRQSQKMESIGQLTGGVAHDFNNLLTPIIGSLDLLSRRGGLGEREQRLVSGALQSAERAKTLVQRLLAFARRQPLQPGPVDVGALVTNMAELVASTSGPQIRVTVEVAKGLQPAIGDVNQLEMAILNLCVNARDAMPQGGDLTVAVAPSGRPPGRPDLPAGPYVRLSVQDTGVGMDEETAARAIEPFFSTKGIDKGTGLGLSMVHGLAMQLEGALSIESKPGVGTRVDLFLRAGNVAAPGEAALHAPAPTGATGRVLVVDDQEQVRMTMAHLLQELGFTTEECESGSVAEMRLKRGEHFDLVVTDHRMPGLSGADLAARLAKTRPEVPVLVVSGYVDIDTIAPELNFLRKPFRKDELANAVDGALREHGSAAKLVGAAAGPA
ncbi:MAG: response regulator [Acetobacteraceae bacterium]|nr:response regulator [Acetobacteraceae bacterium]